MAVYDRWHKSHPRRGEQPCTCGTAKRPLYPTADHGIGTRWQVRYRDDEGKQRKRNFDKKQGRDPETCADAFDAKNNHELHSDNWIDPDAGRVLLGTYVADWRKGLTSDPASLETVDRHLKHIEALHGHQVRALSKRPSTVQAWVNALQGKGLAAITIRQIVGVLSSIYIAAIDDGLAERNPARARSVKLPTVPKRSIVPWTLPMVEAARAELARRHASPAMVDLAAAAGLRESEVFAFAEDDIEFLGHDRKIHVRRQVKRVGKVVYFDRPKGGRERTVPLSDYLAASLAEQIRLRDPVEVELPWGRPDGPPRTVRLLFVAPNGRPWYRQSFQHTWNAARKAAGAPPPPDENGRIHGLRHTYASMQLAAGADVRKLASWLGHSDPGFTLRIYTHLMPDVADVGRRAVDAFFGGAQRSAPNVPSEAGER